WSKPKKNGSRGDVDERSLQAEAERRGASAPFRELTGGAPDWNMRVDVAPLDRRFPQLVRLSDPAYAGEVLGAHGQVPEIGWVRYRPGQRHVLRYDVAPGDGRVPIFLKLYEADDARRAYEDLARICDWLAARHSDVASLRAASLLEADSALTFPQVRGTPLSAYLERPNPWLPWLLERTGAALR